MSVPRKFDWDEAKRLHEAGLSYAVIGDRFGVSPTAIARACREDLRRAMAERLRQYQQSGTCPDCGGVATRVYGVGQRRCRKCFAISRTESVRATMLRCIICRKWKHDDAFPHDKRRGYRRGRHRQCTVCNTAAKRAWREKNKVECSHGCGTMVNGKNRDNPDKPPECRPCSLERIRTARFAA